MITRSRAQTPRANSGARSSITALFGLLLVAGLLFTSARSEAYCAPTGETPSCPANMTMCSYPETKCADGKQGWACYSQGCPNVPGFRRINASEAGGNGYRTSSHTKSPLYLTRYTYQSTNR